MSDEEKYYLGIIPTSHLGLRRCCADVQHEHLCVLTLAKYYIKIYNRHFE